MEIEKAIERLETMYCPLKHDAEARDLAVQALREQQEREKGCQFCTGRPGELKRAAGHKYCYMCGRRLKEAQGDES